MKETTLINNSKYARKIFNSLMSVQIYEDGHKNHWNIQKDLIKLERQGKLRFYIPEE